MISLRIERRVLQRRWQPTPTPPTRGRGELLSPLFCRGETGLWKGGRRGGENYPHHMQKWKKGEGVGGGLPPPPHSRWRERKGGRGGVKMSPHPPRAGVRWQRRCTTRQSLRELDRPGYRMFVVFAVSKSSGRYIPYRAGWTTLAPREGDGRITQCVVLCAVSYVIAYPSLSPEMTTPENTLYHSVLSPTCKKART